MNILTDAIRTAANEIAASDKSFSVWNIHTWINIVPLKIVCLYEIRSWFLRVSLPKQTSMQFRTRARLVHMREQTLASLNTSRLRDASSTCRGWTLVVAHQMRYRTDLLQRHGVHHHRICHDISALSLLRCWATDTFSTGAITRCKLS